MVNLFDIKKHSLQVFIYRLFSKIVYLQLLIIVPIYLFFIFTIFPGSIVQNYKLKILSKNVYGFELANWANKNLTKKDILLSTHRSISLFENETYSNVFTWHTKPENKDSFKYFDLLKEKKVNRILFYGTQLDKQIYKNYIGKELHFKKNIGRHVGRNPFTKKKYYNGWIFELNYEKFPDCLIR